MEAAGGDRRALGELCREVQHPIYRLALRMLSDPQDAEDATQEVLVRLVKNLGSFEGRSKFMTWAYTIATRQLLRTRKRRAERSVRGAEAFVAVIDAGMGRLRGRRERDGVRRAVRGGQDLMHLRDAPVPLQGAQVPRRLPPAALAHPQDDARDLRPPLRAGARGDKGRPEKAGVGLMPRMGRIVRRAGG